MPLKMPEQMLQPILYSCKKEKKCEPINFPEWVDIEWNMQRA